MKIGIFGAHFVGMRLAHEFAGVGHDVVLTTSSGREGASERLKKQPANPAIKPASMSEVIDCEVVVLAMPWVKRQEVLDPAIAWDGRILIDVTNIYLNYRREDLKGETGSDIIATLAPGARVAKAFNTLPFDIMFASPPAGMKRVLFAAGDDTQAVAMVCRLAEEIGFHPVALGSLPAGRLMELEAPLSMLDAFTRMSEGTNL